MRTGGSGRIAHLALRCLSGGGQNPVDFAQYLAQIRRPASHNGIAYMLVVGVSFELRMVRHIVVTENRGSIGALIVIGITRLGDRVSLDDQPLYNL